MTGGAGHNIGFSVRSDTVTDALDRPHYLLEGHQPIAELI